ncbi:MAG: hypothetical protein ACKOX3_04575 [Bacteroidota bacterium]
MSLQILDKLANCQSKVQITELALEIVAYPQLLPYYFKLCDQHELEDANKAAWVIRTYFQKIKKIKLIDQKKVLTLLDTTYNEAVLRNLSGILADLPFDEKIEDETVHVCFKILSDLNHEVAVYSNVLLILIPIIKKYPALKDEIKILAERNPMKDKCAFQLRVKTVLSLTTENLK